MPERTTRAQMLERTLLTGGGIAAGGFVIAALPDLAGSQPSPKQDVEILQKALGEKARKAPKLDFGDDTTSPKRFTDAALKLEDLAVQAYNAAAPALTKAALGAAAKIVSVEARHAAWIRSIAGVTPAPDASEPQISVKRATTTLNGSGYIK
jgi:hypothetical protein